MAVAAELQVRDKLFIGGEWVDPAGSETIDVVNAATEEVMGRIPQGTPQDVDRAVAAARAAFESWSQAPLEERANVVRAIAAGLAARSDEIAATIAQELGMPIGLSKAIQAGLPTMTFTSVPDLVEEIVWQEEIGNSLVVREPIGVVGAITPWNYPLHQIAAKVAPALAVGCTVVLKPSEVAPLNAFILAEIIAAAGAPAGVFNLVTGTGPVVGEAIASHPGVDMVSFTGSTRAGRRVSELAAQSVKPVALELGGKSPNVILDDADLETAVTDGVSKCFLNSGQTCSALTRMLVPRERLAEAEQIAAAVAGAFTVGDPFGEETKLGPLVSDVQRERVRGYIRKGVDEGAKLVAGGAEAPDGLGRGYFVRPTVFSDVRSDMTIAQEEIFGPVLSIIPYDGEEDAVRIANDSSYGLAGGVWSADEDRAKRVARRIRTGQVEINGGVFNPLAPFGGYKQSGHGRELGRYALEEYPPGEVHAALSRVRFETLAAGGYGLLEAPCWDGDGGVYFSDVLQGGVRRWSAGGIEDVVPKRRGIGGLCRHADGGLVISGRDVLRVHGAEQRVLLGDVEGVTGFNDLGVDPQGRVYVGALRFKPFAGEEPKPGQVWRIDAEGATPVLEGIDWPNGIGFSPDGAEMYVCDYAHGTVRAGDGGTFARSPAGSADGLAVDETGGVWVALGEGGGIARFAADGSLDSRVDVPADFVTSLCFGGDDLRDVYVTTMGALLRGRSDVAGLPVPAATV